MHADNFPAANKTVNETNMKTFTLFSIGKQIIRMQIKSMVSQSPNAL